MKTLIDHINEALKIGKDISSFSTYSCQPKSRDELLEIIKDRITKDGPKCDLNDIDVNLITDMSWLFNGSIFNGNISNWDVSNVSNMTRMFSFSRFNGDISKWDVRNVRDMSWMFYDSKFAGDISNWKINENCNFYNMFGCCKISKEHKPKLPQK